CLLEDDQRGTFARRAMTVPAGTSETVESRRRRRDQRDEREGGHREIAGEDLGLGAPRRFERRPRVHRHLAIAAVLRAGGRPRSLVLLIRPTAQSLEQAAVASDTPHHL